MVVKNTIWLGIEKLSKSIYTFLVILLFARFYSDTLFGNYSFSKSFLGIISTFSYMGMSGIIVSNLLERKQDRGQILGSSLSIKLIISFSIFLLSILWGMFFLETASERIIFILTICPVIFFPLDIFEFYFQAKNQTRQYAKPRLITNLVTFFCIVGCLYLNLDIKYPLIILIIDIAVYSACIFLQFSKENIPLVFSKDEALILLKDSLPLLISGLLAMSNLKVDQIMIKHLLGAEQVASYAVCSNIIDPLSLLGMILMSGIFPYLHKKYTSTGTTDDFYNANKIVSLIGIIFIILSFSFSDPIMNLIYGPKYISSSNIFRIHSLSLIFLLWGQVYFKWVLIKKCYYFTLLSHGLGAILNIILNIYLLKLYGVIGASYATIISYSCSFSLILAFNKSTRQLLVYQLKSIITCFNIIGSYKWIKNLK